MKLIYAAIKAYDKNDFILALHLFEQAEIVYGTRAVSFNIYLCKKRISECSKFSKSFQVDFSEKIPLDFSTRFMLFNMGMLNLSLYEQQESLDSYRKLCEKKSQKVEQKLIDPPLPNLPKDLSLRPIPDSTNDWRWDYEQSHDKKNGSIAKMIGLSIVVPTFNRSDILDITLACLVNQVTKYSFEVLVADDGSSEAIDLVVRRYESFIDIKYVRQRDYGYQLCAVRNLGLRASKYAYVAILDCDMAPNVNWVDSYMELLVKNENVALIGIRKYVDTSEYCAKDFLKNKNLLATLPEIKTNNSVAGKEINEISIDWRLEHFYLTENLRLCDAPFRFFSGGNVAFSRKWLAKIGYFDEDFVDWGGEDNEFGYRLYKHGCFFRAVHNAIAYHQEPPGKENETDRSRGKSITTKIVRNKVPYYYRKLSDLSHAVIHENPLVSIYIPAYNCEDTIIRCINSALNQTVTDLEICICDDGSTDSTSDILSRYSNNPRIRVFRQKNSGIGGASNAAVQMARGFYIGQLDSDDYLEPDAVELCLREFLANRKLICVYTSYRNVTPQGEVVSNGYNWPKFSREKLLTGMIVHHFRMFTLRAWHQTNGFSADICNAVDYDMFLKLSEVGEMKHINKVSYNRTLHGQNTSIVKSKEQWANHIIVVNRALKRNGSNYQCIASEDNGINKTYEFVKTNYLNIA